MLLLSVCGMRLSVKGQNLTCVLYPLLSGVITRVLPLPSLIPVVVHGVILPRMAVSVGHGVVGDVAIATDVRNGGRVHPRLGCIVQAAVLVATVLRVSSPVPVPPVIIGISPLPRISIASIYQREGRYTAMSGHQWTDDTYTHSTRTSRTPTLGNTNQTTLCSN